MAGSPRVRRMLTLCPVCGGRLAVRRLHCVQCQTAIEGHFELGRLGRLSRRQIEFVEAFLKCEGKLSRMEEEVGLSYPTLRARLTEIIEQMGFSKAEGDASTGGAS